MSDREAAIDIGGSGCRAAWVTVGPDGRHHVGHVHRLGQVDSVDDLAAGILATLGQPDRIGISTAGFVDATSGRVHLCRVQPWVDGPIAERLRRRLSDIPVGVVNDGEAHLRGHLGLIARHPALCFSIGTSLAFGITDEAGEVARPRRSSNWDIGAMARKTAASNPEIWWCLGSKGLGELQAHMGHAEGTKHFGWRLGSLLRDFVTLFQPRTIILGGGIIAAHAEVVVPAAESELARTIPESVELPKIIRSPFGDDSALVGAALLAYSLRS